MTGAVMLFTCFLIAPKSEAQVRVGININIGDQPPWRAPGYDYVEYYYLPEIETYYYVPRRQFIYISNGRWIFSSSLPPRYRGYNLYTGTKIVINRSHAYKYFEQDRKRYGRHDNGLHRGWHKQKRRGHH